MNKERRASLRVSIPESVANCRFLSKETSGNFQFAVWPVKNISSQGVAIISEEKISEGALAFLNIDLDVIMKTVGVIAKVIWCSKKQYQYEIGLNFSWWPNIDDKKLVVDYISNRFGYNTVPRGKPVNNFEST